MYKTVSKKIVAFVMTLVVIFSCYGVALAKQQQKAFKIRWSNGYGFSGVYVLVTTSKDSDNYGTIKLASDITINLPEKQSFTLRAGTTWDYKISSMKDGGTITLVTDYNEGKGNTDPVTYGGLRDYGMAKMTAKIHISGSKTFYHIWKIDAFTRYHTPEGISPKAWGRGIPYEDGLARPGFYFRDT